MTDEEIIVGLYRQENAAMTAKDVKSLDEILAPDMTLRHMTGYLQPKQEWLSQIQSGEMHYFSSEEEKIKDIHIAGNHASLVGQNKVKASVWGSRPAVWRLQMKMEFAKVHGRWIIASQQASTY
ncbi:DUF4440 domain-containing protein [Lactobacillus nasalidis]|uniref:DUF4440 domain-containing protein n=1 Tax=Lactobacillus nasalidis TaxID=2797258 RepID=A0ABQ3W662_9LACO|nr:nuclear transport factor 2 family protein [Lactobacillus nasalidis]GHV97129.1 DUF4440 domain-containing protein [Lactobacillus nasalidis]GHV99018.1 DUF4440 domain-containing protein [Lactobacillus nasalidis]GHW02043.1 DUF4440 domain-containing protein [Lactobacillus nasalidis]